MIKNALVFTLTFFILFYRAQTFVATYGFPEVTTNTGQTDPSNVPQVSGLSFGSFKAAGTSPQPNASGRFSFTGWPLGGLNGSDDYSYFTGALSPTVYYEVCISVNPGYTLNISAIRFSMRRSGSGIRNYCVRSGRDNYIHNLAASTGTNTRLSVIPDDIFFWNYDSVSITNEQWGSSVAGNHLLSNISDSVTFRFFAWNAESAGGSFSIDNVSFTGTVTDTGTLTRFAELKNDDRDVFRVYPNPCTKAVLTLEHREAVKQIELILPDGKSIVPVIEQLSPYITQVPVSAFENGVYFLRATTETGVLYRKFTVMQR